jgi:hypothetical protein
MVTLDELSFLIRARSGTGHVRDEIEKHRENPATTRKGMVQELAACADEDKNIHVLCAYEAGDVVVRFIAEDKLMRLMSEPANDDGQGMGS